MTTPAPSFLPRFGILPSGVEINGQSIRIAVETRRSDNYTGAEILPCLSVAEHEHLTKLLVEALEDAREAFKFMENKNLAWFWKLGCRDACGTFAKNCAEALAAFKEARDG